MASTLPTFSDLANTTLTIYDYGDQVGARVVGDLTELRALATSASNTVVIVQDKGDGFVGIYNWNAASVAADDGLGVIAPDDGGTGRWILNL